MVAVYVSVKSLQMFTILTFCIVGISLIPSLLVFTYNIIEPFTNSVIALAKETQFSGHIPFEPYTTYGYWQVHANSISARGGIISLVTILSVVTGLPIYTVCLMPLPGIMSVILAYLIGRRLGARLTGVVFAVIMGFSTFHVLTETSIGYQSYGNLLQLIIIFIIVLCYIDRGKWSRSDVLVVSLLFWACSQAYYTAEFLTIAIFLSITLFSFKNHSKYDTNAFKVMSYFTLLGVIIFLGFDFITYVFMRNMSIGVLANALVNYFSYLISLITRESTATLGPSRPYTNPLIKYLDMTFNVLNWMVIVVCVSLYLKNVRKTTKSHARLTRKENSANILAFSLLFAFGTRLLIYGLLGKIAIGWIYVPIITIILAQTWFVTRKHNLIKYIMPLLIVVITLLSFSLTWTETISIVGVDYYHKVNPCASWIANIINSGSLVSSNQISAQIFGVVAELGKANSISVNEFGSDVGNLNNTSNLYNVLVTRGYSYLILAKMFENQPIYGGFWGPYLQPLGDKLESFDNYIYFSRIYDDGMLMVHKIGRK